MFVKNGFYKQLDDNQIDIKKCFEICQQQNYDLDNQVKLITQELLKKDEQIDFYDKGHLDFDRVMNVMAGLERFVQSFFLFEGNFFHEKEKVDDENLALHREICELRQYIHQLENDKAQLEQLANDYQNTINGLQISYKEKFCSISKKMQDMLESSFGAKNLQKIRKLEDELLTEVSDRIRIEQRLNSTDSELKQLKMDYQALQEVNNDMNLVSTADGFNSGHSNRDFNNKGTKMLIEENESLYGFKF